MAVDVDQFDPTFPSAPYCVGPVIPDLDNYTNTDGLVYNATYAPGREGCRVNRSAAATGHGIAVVVAGERPELRACGMRLGFMLYPENDLSAGIEQWSAYGLKPLWWPDEETVLLGSSRGSRAHVMLEDNGAEQRLGPGPVFVVDNVDAYRSEHTDMQWLMEPCSVPAGRYAVTLGPGGSPLRILDLTNDLGEHRTLFPA